MLADAALHHQVLPRVEGRQAAVQRLQAEGAHALTERDHRRAARRCPVGHTQHLAHRGQAAAAHQRGPRALRHLFGGVAAPVDGALDVVDRGARTGADHTAAPARAAAGLVEAVEAAAGLEAHELRFVQAAGVEQAFEGLAEPAPLARRFQLHRHAIHQMHLAHGAGVGVFVARAEVGLGRFDHARGEGRPADQARAEDPASVGKVVDGRQRRLRGQLPGLQRQQPAARQHVHAVQRLHDRPQLRVLGRMAAEPGCVQAGHFQLVDRADRGGARLLAQDGELAEHLPGQQLTEVGFGALSALCGFGAASVAADARTALQHEIQPVGRVALAEHHLASGEGLDAVALGAAELAQHAFAQAAGTQLVVLARGGAQLLREGAAGLQYRQQAVARQHQQPAVRERAHSGVAPCAIVEQQSLLAEVGARLQPREHDLRAVEGPAQHLHRAAGHEVHAVAVLALSHDGLSRQRLGLGDAGSQPPQRIDRQPVERRHAVQQGQRLVGGHRRLAR